MSTINKAQWQADAENLVRAVAAISAMTGVTFTSNDIWEAGVLDTPPNLRWLGPVMQRLRNEGVIIKVGDGVLSERGHGSRMNAMWLGA